MRKRGYEFDKIGLSDESEYPEESEYWYTMRCERTVLAVTRSVNTTLALLDGLPDLLQDHRVQVLFTVMPRQRDANFDRWMRRLIRQAGVREIDWHQATGRRFDLVVTASYEGYLSQLSGPTVILNHGTGVGKYLAIPADGLLPVSDDGTSTTTMVLSHPEQRAYYAAEQHPRVRFLVAGDPWHDRLRSSLHRRRRYRIGLGLGDRTRLIMASSTWGEYSLIATRPELPSTLLEDLPHDQYRVALVLHPNVWFGHSTWQVRAWLRQAVDRGLILVPPHDSWRGVLVAADGFVGDHGSMMLHAAALGLPLAFGCTPNEELIDGGPSAELEERALRLDLDLPLLPQVECMFSEHDHEQSRSTIDRVFERPGEALSLLRREMYGLMNLTEPSEPPKVLAVDIPDVIQEEVTAHRVETEVRTDGSVSVARYPAEKAVTPPPPPNLTSWSRTKTESFDFFRVPRSFFGATAIPTAPGVARSYGKTPARCSARPSTTLTVPCSVGAAARRSRSRRSRAEHPPSTTPWRYRPYTRIGFRAGPATRSHGVLPYGAGGRSSSSA